MSARGVWQLKREEFIFNGHEASSKGRGQDTPTTQGHAFSMKSLLTTGSRQTMELVPQSLDHTNIMLHTYVRLLQSF